MRKVHGSILALTMLTLFAGSAQASITKRVHKAFRGKLLVSEQAVVTQDEDPKATIKALKSASKKQLKHIMEDGVATWPMHFIAFMKRAPGATQISLDFYTNDREKRYVASKRFSGIDPTIKLLQSRIEITEDDGVKRGVSYILKLTAQVKGKEIVLAKTELKLE